MDILKEVIKRIEKTGIIKKNDRIVVGCSGGPDSIFLLEVLLSIREKYNLNLALVHINHLYRGKEALRDENFVKELGEKYSIPVFVRQKSMENLAKDKKISLEEAGREIRYSFFEEILEKINGNKVALAHNLDDQIETFMFRLIRGSSFEGLEGISDVRDKFIRPINEISKSDIMDYLNINKIEYKIDSTNLENNYTRNSIRLDLIPFIEKRYNPKFKEKIFKFMKEIREINSILNVEYNEYIVDNFIDISKLKKENLYIQKKIINYFLNINSIEASRNKIENIINLIFSDGSKKIKLDKDYTLVKEYDRISIALNKISQKEVKEVELKVPGEVEFGDYIIKASITSEKKALEKYSFITNLSVGDTILIRQRKAGDKILLKGMENYKKIKDILINEKISKYERDNIPVVLHNEEVVWLVGIKKSEKYFCYEDKARIILTAGRKDSGR